MIIEAYEAKGAGGSRWLKPTDGLRTGSLPHVTLHHGKLVQIPH
jgi:hypothetical protein